MFGLETNLKKPEMKTTSPRNQDRDHQHKVETETRPRPQKIGLNIFITDH